mgnify:FL=1
MSEFLSKKFEKLTPYTPGEQPQDKSYIKLNTNESPYPPSDKVAAAVTKSEIDDLRLYPDPECCEVRESIAKEYGVNPQNVFVSNGSDETLSFAFMAFCDETHPAVFPDISYGFYEVYAMLYGIPYKKIPLKEDFTVDVNDYTNCGATVVIANPNAPTGLCISVDDVRKILETNKNNVVLIDEAYVDFGGESCVGLIKKYDNLLVVRTYSKSRSLAGARLGYAMGSEKIIGDLNTIKFSTNPYNINRISLIAAKCAMENDEYYRDKIGRIVSAREYTVKELKRLGFSVTDSKANFVFAKHDKIGGEEVYAKLKDNGILVRHFGSERIKDYVRISVGTREDMQCLVKTLEKILEAVI